MLTNNARLMTRGMVLMALVLGGILAAYLSGATRLQAAVPPPQGCGNTIGYDQWEVDELANGALKCYTFEGRAGDVIAISMTRLDAEADLDPFLELLGTDGSYLGWDDDGGGDLNSLIVFELPYSGAYNIRAGSYQGRGAGWFELRLNRLVCGGPIAYGQEVINQVPPGASCMYAFAGHAGEVVGIQAQRTAGMLQPHIELRTPDGWTISSNDEDSSSLIEDIALQTDGTYLINVAAQDGQATGAFSLTLWRKDACGGEPRSDFAEHAEISSWTPRCYYTFQASSMLGDVYVDMTAKSGNLKPGFQVVGPDGVAVSAITDHWSGGLPDGTYTIIALGQEGTAGRFELTISKPSSLRARLALCGHYPLDSGEMRSDHFYKGHSCTYRFEGTAGDVVTILMTRADAELDPYLWLYAGNSSIEETQDDDSAGDGNSLINEYRLERSGEYRVVAGSYNNASGGDYYLTFWRMR